jgi:hypothetical protein
MLRRAVCLLAHFILSVGVAGIEYCHAACEVCRSRLLLPGSQPASQSSLKSKIPHGRRRAMGPQAMVSMMLPSALVELLEELEFELPRSAIELLTNDEIID